MAARLEGLATPGGISCSAAVRTQIGNKEATLWFKNDSDLDSIRSHPRYPKRLELAE